MTSESTSTPIDLGLDDLLNQHFGGRVVRKDLTKLVKEGANVPVYVLEYLLGQYCASDDEVIIQEGLQTVKQILAENYVRPDEAEKVKSKIRERGSFKIIDKVTVTLNEKRDKYEALLSNLGTKGTQIPDGTVKKYEKLLAGGIWCIITVNYFHEEEQAISPFLITELKPIQMPNMDMDALFEGRKSFTEEQWIDVLMRSTGMEPAYLDSRFKWHLLARLLPFVENNFNLCELGPKGTGKSHIYKEISPNSILISGGQTTVANLFYNLARRTVGLVGFWDTVAFDEVAGINFRDADGVQIMKDFMASGSFARGRDSINAQASMVFVGNISNVKKLLQTSHLLAPFPEVMIDTAFFDRMHVYIPGWEVPKMRPEFFTNRYGMIVDYLAEFLREMRKYSFADAIDRYFELGTDLNQRDTIAVRRTVSGFLKLLYPHGDYNKEAVRRCLEYALEARRRVKEQLFKLEPEEFKDVNLGYVDKETQKTHIIGVPEHAELSTDSAELENQKLDTVPPIDQKPETSQQKEEDPDKKTDSKTDSKTEHVLKLIAKDENSVVEFKSSARWNHKKGGVHTGVELSIIRTVAGFMNAKGGTLLIGVSDKGKVLGLESDLKVMLKGNKDGYSLWLTDKIVSCIGSGAALGANIDFVSIDGKDVCCVEVEASSQPAFVNMAEEKIKDEFYVRMNNQTRRLSKAELLDYQKDRWGG